MTSIMDTPQAVLRKARGLGFLFFFSSGLAALIYEMLWVRLFSLVFGNTTHAISAVLAAYMAGLGLGSFWIGRYADRWKRPMLAYGCLEIGIGAYAILTLPILSFIQSLYVLFAHQFHPSTSAFTAVRLGLSLAIMLIPTFFMGATLPVLAKFYIRRSEAIGSTTALLYGINTAGAMAGTLLTGFMLLPTFGVRSTLTMAVALNVGIGLLACLLSKELRSAGLEGPSEPRDDSQPTLGLDPAPPKARFSRWIPAGLFISGATAMMYEVTWSRALAAVLGSSTYAFTLMLATFLLGLSLGSATFERILSRRQARLSDWGGLQCVIALFAAFSFSCFDRLGIVTVRLFSLTIGSFAWLELMRWLVLGALMIVPTFCFGALFPVSAALHTRNASLLGRGIGLLYLSNTYGNIVGSLATGFVLIPVVGIYRTAMLAVWTGALLGFLALWADPERSARLRLKGALALCLLAAVVWAKRDGWDPRLLTGGLHVRPAPMVGLTSTEILANLCDRQILFYREGVNSIVGVVQLAQTRFLTVNGKVDASTGEADMATQVLSGHLPHLLHPDPQRTLVIGFGSGTTVSHSLDYPVRELDCVEIEPAVLEAAAWFAQINRRGDQDPRVRLILNDARNHLLIEQTPYDVIISEPSNPWIAGVASLFTTDFYRLVRKQLTPDGILCQWLQAYTFDPRDFQRVVASVQNVFAYVTIWQTNTGDFLIIASAEPILFPLEEIQRKLQEDPKVREDLKAYGIREGVGLLAYFLLGAQDVRRYVEGAALNTDDLLVLEFSAPRALYTDATGLIRDILAKFQSSKYPSLSPAANASLQKPEALTEIGTTHLHRGFIELAEECFRQALDGHPDFAPAQLGMGRCLLAKRQWVEALAYLKQAAEALPHLPEAKAFLGCAYLQGGDAQAAWAALEEEAPLDAPNWQFLHLKGQALEQLERWEEAAQAYRRALELAPPNALTTRLRYAHTLTESGRPEEAVRLLEELRVEFPTHPDIYEEIKRACIHMGNLSPAITAYEAITRTNPYRFQYWASLAQLYAKQGNRAAAVRAVLAGERTHPYFHQFLRSLPEKERPALTREVSGR